MASLSRGCKLRITVVPTAVEDDCYANIFVRGGDGGGQTSCIMGDVVVANAKKFSGSKTVTENTISRLKCNSYNWYLSNEVWFERILSLNSL